MLYAARYDTSSRFCHSVSGPSNLVMCVMQQIPSRGYLSLGSATIYPDPLSELKIKNSSIYVMYISSSIAVHNNRDRYKTMASVFLCF